MYDYIFWILYSRNINRNKGEWLSRNNASGVVFFAIFIHIAFFIQIIKKIVGSKSGLRIINFNSTILIVVFLLCILCVYLYYNKYRIARIERKYKNSNSAYIKFGGWIVAILIFVPLLIIIILGWKG
ncbi:hypothetical protein [Hydrotalea sandarakina]|jgi:uncharacterized membrane protein YidH (DUF202 family)|uniref:Uncharacterized protein n=1 Tax=Hydrotalea sandarakina TaxID=1004304 RepID=A0A2W7RG39_9BACT|nr:hypothetical protein [Hydrotalea sandarakina]PZX59121.1 hypothetical protein LX80_02872 [Hydrotalea sandarakina]